MGVELEYGEVSAVDYQGCRIRVRLDGRDGVESYWLNVPQRNTQGVQCRPILPELDEQVAVLLDSDGIGGVYLGGVYSVVEPPPVVDENTHYVRFKDGTVLTYEQASSEMSLDCVGAVTLKCAKNLDIHVGESLVIKAPKATLDIPQVTLNGNLQVNGDINATGKILDVGGNSSNHKH
ncbi:phage baseplate assembly protein V [Pseudomonas sp. 18175]|uniref:phage baseplate assembly protein V n=1 Tax=Pseudomonas sp. 18175 TaxID=3390056 RepID=UPI003D1F8697